MPLRVLGRYCDQTLPKSEVVDCCQQVSYIRLGSSVWLLVILTERWNFQIARYSASNTRILPQ
jgi:hypothetical protein